MTPERLAEIERDHGWQVSVTELLTALREAQQDIEHNSEIYHSCERAYKVERNALQRRVEALENFAAHEHWIATGIPLDKHEPECAGCTALRGQEAG